MALASASTEPATNSPMVGPAGLPSISIIIPTYNRAFVLPYLLRALVTQVYPATLIEAIIVDNSSSDDTEAVVCQWSARAPFPMRFYRKENRGPAASRNFGAARARGEILAFTDSDCIPDRGWLRRSVHAFSEGAGIVCGPFLPAKRDDESLLVSQQDAITHDRGCYPTANLLLRRGDLEAVGGFDERFGMYPWGELVAGEDTDLAWRIKRRGVRATFVNAAIVWHLATPSSLGRILLRPLVAQIIPALLGQIPELRDQYLWKRYFQAKLHLYFHLAWVGALAAFLTGLWPLWFLALPWLSHTARHVLLPCWRAQGAARGSIKFLLLVYRQVACALVMIGASLRYRRVVL